MAGNVVAAALGALLAVSLAVEPLAVLRVPLTAVLALLVIWSDWPALLRLPLAGMLVAALAWLALGG
jgi:hypothetical protein